MQVNFLEVITDFICSLETSCSSEIPAQFIYYLNALKEENGILSAGTSFLQFSGLKKEKVGKNLSHLNIENEEFSLR